MDERKNSLLELDGLSVAVEERTIVHDVTMAVSGGSVSLLMGPNGSGKSTLVNALMGHPAYRVVSGSVRSNGEDVTSATPDQRAKQGLFLSLQHVPRIGGINLATFLHKVHVALTGEEVDVLAYYLRLRESAEHYGIPDELLDRPLTAGLSGGEKKLSEVLQLAAIKPKIAILDEIDSGVDVDAMKRLFSAIGRLKETGMGFLLISHHPTLLDHLRPDVVHVMANGRLRRTGDATLAQEVLAKGFCGVIDCPLVDSCSVAGPNEGAQRHPPTP